MFCYDYLKQSEVGKKKRQKQKNIQLAFTYSRVRDRFVNCRDVPRFADWRHPRCQDKVRFGWKLAFLI